MFLILYLDQRTYEKACWISVRLHFRRIKWEYLVDMGQYLEENGDKTASLSVCFHVHLRSMQNLGSNIQVLDAAHHYLLDPELH